MRTALLSKSTNIDKLEVTFCIFRGINNLDFVNETNAVNISSSFIYDKNTSKARWASPHTIRIINLDFNLQSLYIPNPGSVLRPHYPYFIPIKVPANIRHIQIHFVLTRPKKFNKLHVHFILNFALGACSPWGQ